MSEVKVNKISPRSGTTVTLGDSGDTFTIPSGATINNQGTATNFGATGAASWNTTVKTGDFTAVAGEGYFVNTTSGAINVTLPAGTAGAVVAIKDYAGTFDTNAVTVVRNGSDKVGGVAVNPILSTEGIAVTFLFVDSTQGWLVTDSGLQSDLPTPTYITATGGTIATCGDFKTHTFTGPGTFTVCSAGNSVGSDSVDYLVVAGGGGSSSGPSSGARESGGGGAGGFRLSNFYSLPAPTTSPLASPAAILVTAQGYPISVGGGGAGAPEGSSSTASNGVNSTFSTITSAGGGFGGVSFNPNDDGNSGGSGGGGSQNPGCSTGSGGAGNTPPTDPPQGQDGGTGQHVNGNWAAGGGGGGAGGTGGNASSPGTGVGLGGTGGVGSFADPAFAGSNGTTGPVSARYFSGGGGGGSYQSPAIAPGGAGGGGNGAVNTPSPTQATVGTVNTGGGGGGITRDLSPGAGKTGGSGIVIIRYKFQN